VSAFGGVVAATGVVDRALAERLVSIFLEVVVAPGFDEHAREVLATKPNLRLVVDPSLDASVPRPAGETDPLGSFRTAGGGVLVTAPDTLPDDPAAWACTTSRQPTGRELADLDLAWRLCRGVVSNAILLVRDGMLVGLGSGQVSRVDACRGAVDKARQFQGELGARGAVAASDAFFPFADGPRVLLDAGVTAIVQPGGSMRDAEVLVDVDKAGAAMLVTGTRHFRH
jgi:phosphoribosylaminoimidazolecarboxamide formyltransferase/IMP cyclohydrolase